jgi:beta-lactamase regulating signal transducer with metallopeptidase domain
LNRLPGFTTKDEVTVEATAALSTSERLTWHVYTMAIWILGVFILGLWLLLKLRNLCKGRPNSKPDSGLPQSFHNTMSRCAGQLKLRRVPDIVVTDKVVCPAVFGVFRPILLMPKGYLSRLSRKDAKHMILHELAHIKRGDPFIHSLCILLQILYWFNPLLWLARRQIHHLRELCCDATVARLLKDKTTEYRETLMDVARRFLAESVEPGLGLLGLFEDSNRLLVRLNWLEKKTWRYRKMKNLTVITIVILMAAFILPMAQAQVTPVEQDTANSGQMEDQEQLSQELQALEARLRQLETDKQQLQNALAQLERRHRDISRRSSRTERRTKNRRLDTSKRTQAGPDEVTVFVPDTEPRLGQMEIERRKLKNDFEAELKELQEEYEEELRELQEEYEQEEYEDEGFQEEEFKAELKEIDEEFEEGWQELEEEFEDMAEEIDELEWPEQMGRWFQGEDMQKWQDKMKNWKNSEEFKQWQEQMQRWKQQMKQWAKDMGKMWKIEGNSSGVKPRPVPGPIPIMPKLPSMPQMPPIPVVPEVKIDVPIIVETPSETVAPDNSSQVPTSTQALQNIEVNKSEDGMFVATAEMYFLTTMKPNASFIVRNNKGNITLSPGKDNNCAARAVIRAKGKTAAEAQQMIESVLIESHSSQDKAYLTVVKPDDGHWKDLNVDFYITLPPGVRLDVKTNMGSIELLNLESKIKAETNMGSIKAGKTSGDLELTTNMGSIDFIASRDISARFKVITNMGSIESDLPLDIDKTDMMKRKAQGTVGSGQDNIRLITNMGKVSIKWQSSP